jgi:hypothetical protein
MPQPQGEIGQFHQAQGERTCDPIPSPGSSMARWLSCPVVCTLLYQPWEPNTGLERGNTGEIVNGIPLKTCELLNVYALLRDLIIFKQT